jgi:hypothetical protein
MHQDCRAEISPAARGKAGRCEGEERKKERKKERKD